MARTLAGMATIVIKAGPAPSADLVQALDIVLDLDGTKADGQTTTLTVNYFGVGGGNGFEESIAAAWVDVCSLHPNEHMTLHATGHGYDPLVIEHQPESRRT